jgi:hypothetical protein
MTTFTVWIQQANGRGTTHVSSHDAASEAQAEMAALEETSADWGDWPVDQLRVLGIAKGSVEIVEWNDYDE